MIKFLKSLFESKEYEYVVQNTDREKGCVCCIEALWDDVCNCQEEQVIDFPDGTQEKYWTRQSCSNWDCSYCH